MSYRQQNLIVMEDENHEALARYIKRVIVQSCPRCDLKLRKCGSRTEVLRRILNQQIHKSIAFVDKDQVHNWPSNQLPILQNSQTLRSFNDIRWYFDSKTITLIIIFDPKVEEWLIRNCQTCQENGVRQGELHENTRKFERYVGLCSDVIGRLADEINNLVRQMGICCMIT